MPYIIDGHNLIPKIQGLSLKDPDDEAQLVEMLQDFCRIRGKLVEVYFDNASIGTIRTRKFGKVTIHFVRQGRTADSAIIERLQRIGKSVTNWTVVSSDRAVLAAARELRTQNLTSDEFARLLRQTLENNSSNRKESSETNLSPQELEEWLDIFKDN